MTEPIGVLVMAYGTASGPEDVERYYTDIRGGRAPSPALLEELKDRYKAIGNRFPLLEITRRQTAALERELEAQNEGGFKVYLGMKHSPPFIREGVAQMRADGIGRGVGLVLAPHYSRLSIGTYRERVEAALANPGLASAPDDIAFSFIESWHDHPRFIEAVSRRVAEALGQLSDDERDHVVVVFTAHSLPAKIVAEGDPYADQLEETADLVAKELDLPAYRTAWQSAGRTPEPWLGPDLGQVIHEVATAGHRAIVVCPCGFVSDHLEILYDLDIEAQHEAKEAGITLVRTRSMNDDDDFIQTLAAVVLEHLHTASPNPS